MVKWAKDQKITSRKIFGKPPDSKRNYMINELLSKV